MVRSIAVHNINTFKMADAHDKIGFKLFKALMPLPGWKYPNRLKLGLGEPWESKCSSDSDVDKVAIPNIKLSPLQLLPLLVQNRVDELHDIIATRSTVRR